MDLEEHWQTKVLNSNRDVKHSYVTPLWTGQARLMTSYNSTCLTGWANMFVPLHNSTYIHVVEAQFISHNGHVIPKCVTWCICYGEHGGNEWACREYLLLLLPVTQSLDVQLQSFVHFPFLWLLWPFCSLISSYPPCPGMHWAEWLPDKTYAKLKALQSKYHTTTATGPHKWFARTTVLKLPAL